jgi:hypothetical protein
MQTLFGPVALHYRVGINRCPAHPGWREGSVERDALVIAQS